MNILSRRAQKALDRQETYEMVKSLLKSSDKKTNVETIYKKVADVKNYSHWADIRRIYHNLRKEDKNPLPLRKKSSNQNISN